MNIRSDAPHILTEDDIRALLPPRPGDSHKGKNGRVLLCVGSRRYTGAALLSAAAALRVGCGLLEAAVPGAVKPAFSMLPEACCTAVSDGDGWDGEAIVNATALLPNRQAIAIGSGMDVCANADLLSAAVMTRTPLVIDADGLNLLARNRDLLQSLHENVVLTPHAGEMARLLGGSVRDVTQNPKEIAAEAAKAWNCVVLLKGAETYIALDGRMAVNRTGNPGLAKGGSGDVLTGLLAGLLAQGLAPFDAACAGAYLLGVSADTALALLGNRMLMAGDVVDAVAATVRSIL